MIFPTSKVHFTYRRAFGIVHSFKISQRIQIEMKIIVVVFELRHKTSNGENWRKHEVKCNKKI